MGVLLGTPPAAGGNDVLKGLDCLRVVAKVQAEPSMAVSESRIASALVVRVRARLPRVELNDDGPRILHAIVRLTSAPMAMRPVGHFGSVHLELVEPVRLLSTGAVFPAAMWRDGGGLVGGILVNPERQAIDMLDTALDVFAAAF